MTEELGLQQVLGNGAAVHRHEGLGAAVALAVNVPGHELLAGATLAADQHAGLGVRHLDREIEDPLQDRAVTDDGALPAASPQLRPKPPVLAREQLLLQGLLHHQADLVDLEGLGDVVVGPLLHGRNGGIGARKGGNHHHHGLRRDIAHAVQQLQPVSLGHLHVRDDQIEVAVLDAQKRTLDVTGRRDLVALPPKEDLEELLHAALVVDDEDPALGRHARSSACGSQMRNLVPTPSVLSSCKLPPWPSTMR